MKLSLKQKKFADEYIISGNITRSAIKAGYSEKYADKLAYKLLDNMGIKSYIEGKLQKLDNEKIAQQKEVLQYLSSVMRGESQAEVVVVEGQGDGISEAKRIKKAPDEKERLKAAELLGKVHGLFTERVEVAGEVVIVDDIDAAGEAC